MKPSRDFPNNGMLNITNTEAVSQQILLKVLSLWQPRMYNSKWYRRKFIRIAVGFTRHNCLRTGFESQRSMALCGCFMHIKVVYRRWSKDQLIDQNVDQTIHSKYILSNAARWNVSARIVLLIMVFSNVQKPIQTPGYRILQVAWLKCSRLTNIYIRLWRELRIEM